MQDAEVGGVEELRALVQRWRGLARPSGAMLPDEANARTMAGFLADELDAVLTRWRDHSSELMGEQRPDGRTVMWCRTHDHAAEVYDDGSIACMYDLIIETLSDHHDCTPLTTAADPEVPTGTTEPTDLDDLDAWERDGFGWPKATSPGPDRATDEAGGS